jgi:hypothetical protein
MKEKEVVKKIKLFTESGLVEISDTDSSSLEEYSKQLSGLLDSSTISILETSSGCLILRPSKVSSIFVSEDKNVKEVKKSQPKAEEDMLVEE